MFLYGEEGQREVWLAKRISAPFEGYWTSVVGNILAGEKALETARREAREELSINVQEMADRDQAVWGEPLVYTIPFLTHITFFPLHLRTKAVIDEQPRFTGNFDEADWYPVPAPPQKSHLSVHFCLGVIEKPENG